MIPFSRIVTSSKVSSVAMFFVGLRTTFINSANEFLKAENELVKVFVIFPLSPKNFISNGAGILPVVLK
jgi:hypothetical protein